MTRQERIEQLNSQIIKKKNEIETLQEEFKNEMITDFYERHGLQEGEHFFYEEKECVGVEMARLGFLKTFPLTAKGEISRKGLIIYSEKSIKPL